tara:strand:+ start:864 stop:1427 length:564 start_codon:yes stop_codon:yes gene_type:complete
VSPESQRKLNIFLLTAALCVVPLTSPLSAPSDASLVEVAASLCKNAKKPVNRQFLASLLKAETAHKVPAYARGITLAAACRESGYRAKPRRGDKGKAWGLLQMWKWWATRYKIDRENPSQAVNAWLTHINRSVRKAGRLCRKPWRAWLVAQAWVASGPQKWRCRYSRHYKLLRYWKWKVRRLTRKAK